MATSMWAKRAAVLGKALLPFVVAAPVLIAHVVFYSTLGVAPREFLNVTHLLPWAFPGLVLLCLRVILFISALYSVVVVLQLVALPFTMPRFRVPARSALAVAMVGLIVFQDLAMLALFTLVVIGLGAGGIAALWVDRRRRWPFGAGVLVGAVLYSANVAALAFALNAVDPDFPPVAREVTGPSLVTLVIMMMGAVVAVLLMALPVAMVVSVVPSGPAHRWHTAGRWLATTLTPRRASVILTAAALVGVSVMASFTARVAAQAAKQGMDVPWSDNPVVNTLVESTYTLAVSCVDVEEARRSDPPDRFPGHAVQLHTGAASDPYFLVWPNGDADRVPRSRLIVRNTNTHLCWPQ